MDIPSDNLMRIIVKPNSPKSEIIAVDEARNALRVNIKAPPEKGKANKEVVKFFSKLLKKKVEIVSGKTSKEKLLKIS
ncbi:YggU family protein [Candidatus Woesearchaeota archaeon]|nr:YggU family protein [Candidatus Woesearchaeota archaeon]